MRRQRELEEAQRRQKEEEERLAQEEALRKLEERRREEEEKKKREEFLRKQVSSDRCDVILQRNSKCFTYLKTISIRRRSVES